MNIFINPGHGQNTQGKCAPDNSYYEWEGARKIARAVELFLCDLNPVNIIGNCPISVSLKDRVNFANWFKGYGVYLSIHTNASKRSGWGSARGSTVLYHHSSKNGKRLASCINKALKKRLPDLPSRGIKPCNHIVDGKKVRPLYELKRTDMPAVIIENAFHDNEEDVKLLKDPKKLDQFALAISEGTREYIRGSK